MFCFEGVFVYVLCKELVCNLFIILLLKWVLFWVKNYFLLINYEIIIYKVVIWRIYCVLSFFYVSFCCYGDFNEVVMELLRGRLLMIC